MRSWTLPEPGWEWEWIHTPVAEPLPALDRESPARRRTTVPTWAGWFTVGRYALQETSPVDSERVVGYGTDIKITFKPNTFV
ncbi:MAG TPA: hypothetical protein VJX66_14435, partial [Amycolatopsis sp.]|nr:hypothetical protein [Amycolatopsis sp.]